MGNARVSACPHGPRRKLLMVPRRHDWHQSFLGSATPFRFMGKKNMQSSDLPSQSLPMAKLEAGKVIQSSGNAVHRAGSHVRGSTWAMVRGVLLIGFRRGKCVKASKQL